MILSCYSLEPVSNIVSEPLQEFQIAHSVSYYEIRLVRVTPIFSSSSHYDPQVPLAPLLLDASCEESQDFTAETLFVILRLPVSIELPSQRFEVAIGR